MNIKFFGLLVLSILLSACSSMYIPAINNIPLLEEKGEAQLEFAVTTNSFHLVGNYAFSDNYAVMLSGNLSYGNISDYYDIFTHKDDDISTYWSLRQLGEFSHKYAEIGIGRFDIIDSWYRTKLECFGGFGKGYAIDYDNGEQGELKFETDYYKFFLQPNLGWDFGFLTLGVGIRFVVNYFDYTYQVDLLSAYRENNGGLPQNINFYMLNLEPMAFIGLGKGKTKLGLRFGFSLLKPLTDFGEMDLEKGISSGSIQTTFLTLSAGLRYSF